MGLDLSLTGTGIAVANTDRLLDVALVGTRPEDGDDVVRADWIADRIYEVCVKWNPEIIVIEDYAHSKSTNVSRLGELGGIVKKMLWQEAGYEPGSWHEKASSTIKKFATGNGRAGKPEMVRAAQPYLAALEVSVRLRKNDNIADAVHLARYGIAEIA